MITLVFKKNTQTLINLRISVELAVVCLF